MGLGARASSVAGLCADADRSMDRVGLLADFTIQAADGTECRVSKALLAAHSEVFG